MGKIQLPPIGGIRKVIKTGAQVAPGTTIAELGDGTITLSQLAAIITQIQAAQQNTGGGNIGAGDEATLLLGPGLSGGGVLVGNVPIRLTAPIPALLAEDGMDGDPGPPGAAGARGLNGATGGVGPAGVAIYMTGDDGEDGWHAIPGGPGPQGVQGVQGSQGPAGTGGSGSSTGLSLWVPDDIVTDEELYRGPASARGFLTVNGRLAVNATASINSLLEVIGDKTVSSMSFGNGAFNAATLAQLGFNNSTGVLTAASASIQLFTGTSTLTAAINISSSQVINLTGPIVANSTNYAASTALSVTCASGGIPFLVGTNSTQLFKIFNDGGVTVGPSTVVDKGPGSVNVTNGYYVNGALVAGGANATPVGTMHGMIAEDSGQSEDEIYRGPASAQGFLTVNGGLTVQGKAIIATPATTAASLLVYSSDLSTTDNVVIDGNSRFASIGYFCTGGLKAQQFWDNTNNFYQQTTNITTATMQFKAGNAILAMTLTSGGAAIISSSLGIKGATPSVTAGQTDLGITTTSTGVITTAGGISLPALAATFWVVNINGTQYGIPCFAL